MLDRRFGHDAMTKIENVRAALKVAQHALDFLVEAPPARDQRQRIEITLERQPLRQRSDGGFGLRGRVEADRVDSGEASEFGKLSPRAAWKGDQPRARRLVANFGCDRRDRRDAPAFEFGWRQDTRPGIEDLRGLRARRELA